ncbi:MAG TPA: DNA polymerase, partial [Candidatus Eisenbacteria bacterium]|nr:DNA polymerase [Candidatus Eisenbacteria bacterium]
AWEERRLPSVAAPAPVAGVAGATAVAPMPAEQASLDLWSGSALATDEMLDEWVAELHAVRARALHGLALLPLLAGGDPRTATLVGLGIAARDGTSAYVPIAHEAGPNVPLDSVKGWLAGALADPTVPKTAHDLKACTHALATLGLPCEAPTLDLHLLSFLLDPERDHGLPALARDVLGRALPSLEPRVVRGRPRPTLAAVAAHAAHDAARAMVATLEPVAAALVAQLEAREQWPLYTDLERPLVPVLLDMERTGVALDRAVLAEMSERAAIDLARLEDELAALAGERINLASGPQLSRVLFEKLGLKTRRRTKTGFSTDQTVLEELAAAHDFPRRLLEWRSLAKLKSTYLDALPAEADPRDSRVHTTFHQAGAATGRLSSSDPNLQNIPMRSPQGRAIRRAFVAPPGRLLVSADYSQIELRVMAHLSGDPALIEAFAAGEDIHASTARRVFGVAAGDALDPTLRARAKIVNFGIMYGMGARSLSQQMGLALAEAEDFIRNYFRVYAGVRAFLDRTVDEARRQGYVQTLLGRRRWLPGLASAHGGERSNAERAAINTPLQGSAADLVKLAMVRVHGALKHSHPSARLLLQVHDELLVECDAAEAGPVADVVAGAMRGAWRMRVPLEVSVGRGPTWLDAH